MRCIDGLTLLMMAEHHPRHAVRVLGRSRSLSDVIVHAKCAYNGGFAQVAIPEPRDPPAALSTTVCAMCDKPMHIYYMVDRDAYRFEDPLPCDFWTQSPR